MSVCNISDDELRGANVNPKSGLATDYLNHFNEYLMLAGMCDSGLESRACLFDWRPVDYVAHFRKAGFAGAATAIDAYRGLIPAFKRLFENAIFELNDLINDHQNNNIVAVKITDIESARDRLANIIANGLNISGLSDLSAQDEIDALFD